MHCFHKYLIIVILFVLLQTMDMSLAKMRDGDLCLVDSATTNTILKDKKYFSHLKIDKANINTISGSAKIVEGFGKANFIMPGGTRFTISDALFSPKSQRNLLSFKDIRLTKRPFVILLPHCCMIPPFSPISRNSCDL